MCLQTSAAARLFVLMPCFFRFFKYTLPEPGEKLEKEQQTTAIISSNATKMLYEKKNSYAFMIRVY